MYKTLSRNENKLVRDVPARGIEVHGWRRWTPYAAVLWSLVYAALGIYWAVSGHGLPYNPDPLAIAMQPIVLRFGPVVTWIVVVLAGIPAAVMGTAMLRGVRKGAYRPFFITTGFLLAGVLLLLMTGLSLLIMLGYLPYVIRSLFSGAAFVQSYLDGLAEWATIHQMVCLIGGFLWLAATASYASRTGEACPYCGRGHDSQGWTSPERAARWGRIAVGVSFVAPVFYAITRYAWVLGIPLGMSEEALLHGQESGQWISGIFMATFGLVGAVLTLGLVQRWGEVFPRWMIGLAGRRVPVALAVVPASLVSVLLIVGGVSIGLSAGGMVAAVQASGVTGIDVLWEVLFQAGPTFLFPLWGIGLAVATLGYYFRRRGPCSVCGRG